MGPVIRNVIRDVIRPVMGDEVLFSRRSPIILTFTDGGITYALTFDDGGTETALTL